MERTGVPGMARAPDVGRTTGGLRQLWQRLESVEPGRLLAAYWCDALVWSSAFAAAWAFASLGLRRHERYYSAAYDFGFFDQIIWNTSHGRWFETSFVDYNFLGQHVEPVLLVFAGAYRLGAGPGFLIVVQGVFAGAAAIPLFYATLALSESRVAALLLALAFLLNPSLHRALDFDFHPELMAFFFVFLSLALVAGRRPLAAACAIVPLLLLKEDMAVIVLLFGVLMWWHGHRLHGVALVATSLAWAIATTFVLMPLVRDGADSDLNERFQYLTTDTNVMTLLPAAAWRGIPRLWHETTLPLVRMVLETGGLAALHPVAVLAIPSSALNGLSDHGPQSQLDLQYAAAPLALMFVSAAFALGRLRRRQLAIGNAATVAATIAAAAAVTFFLGDSPYASTTLRHTPSETHRTAIAEALSAIPPEANVSAQNTLVPHLSRRAQIFEFPDVRPQTEYVIVDAELPITAESRSAGYEKWLVELPAWGFEKIFDHDGVQVFSREVDR